MRAQEQEEQALRGMKHVQKVEGIEFGLMLIFYAVLLNVALSIAQLIGTAIVALLLCWHWQHRRASYYRHQRRFIEAKWTLDDLDFKILPNFTGLIVKVGITIALEVMLWL